MSISTRVRQRLGERGMFVFVGVLVAVLATGGALALTLQIHLFGSSDDSHVDVELDVDLPAIEALQTVLDPISYEIHTLGGSGCGTAKVVSGRYGIPQPVDVGGSILPDLTVTVSPSRPSRG